MKRKQARMAHKPALRRRRRSRALAAEGRAVTVSVRSARARGGALGAWQAKAKRDRMRDSVSLARKMKSKLPRGHVMERRNVPVVVSTTCRGGGGMRKRWAAVKCVSVTVLTALTCPRGLFFLALQRAFHLGRAFERVYICNYDHHLLLRGLRRHLYCLHVRSTINGQTFGESDQ